MDLGLQGAKVFVAASRSGLGAATARRFSLEGAFVAVNGRNADTVSETADAIQRESSNHVVAIPGDVSLRDDARQMVEQAAAELGGLDILVTNSGGPRAGIFTDLTMDDWDSAYHLLLGSTIQMIMTGLPYLQHSDRAAILTVTSITVKQPVGNLLLSNVMRTGIASLVKSLANELGPQGIRINSILPGWTATDRVEHLLQARAQANNTTPQEERAARIDNIPVRRIGTPEEFGNVAAFLCSPAAGFIHGALIPVEGGEIRSTF
jgi:3-oxoacyl-[acyl-carrier protein] reductase